MCCNADNIKGMYSMGALAECASIKAAKQCVFKKNDTLFVLLQTD